MSQVKKTRNSQSLSDDPKLNIANMLIAKALQALGHSCCDNVDTCREEAF